MLVYHLRPIYLPLSFKNFKAGLEFVCANNNNNNDSKNFFSKLRRDLGRHEKLLEHSRTFEELRELPPPAPAANPPHTRDPLAHFRMTGGPEPA